MSRKQQDSSDPYQLAKDAFCTLKGIVQGGYIDIKFVTFSDNAGNPHIYLIDTRAKKLYFYSQRLGELFQYNPNNDKNLELGRHLDVDDMVDMVCNTNSYDPKRLISVDVMRSLVAQYHYSRSSPALPSQSVGGASKNSPQDILPGNYEQLGASTTVVDERGRFFKIALGSKNDRTTGLCIYSDVQQRWFEYSRDIDHMQKNSQKLLPDAVEIPRLIEAMQRGGVLFGENRVAIEQLKQAAAAQSSSAAAPQYSQGVHGGASKSDQTLVSSNYNHSDGASKQHYLDSLKSDDRTSARHQPVMPDSSHNAGGSKSTASAYERIRLTLTGVQGPRASITLAVQKDNSGNERLYVRAQNGEIYLYDASLDSNQLIPEGVVESGVISEIKQASKIAKEIGVGFVEMTHAQFQEALGDGNDLAKAALDTAPLDAQLGSGWDMGKSDLPAPPAVPAVSSAGGGASKSDDGQIDFLATATATAWPAVASASATATAVVTNAIVCGVSDANTELEKVDAYVSAFDDQLTWFSQDNTKSKDTQLQHKLVMNSTGNGYRILTKPVAGLNECKADQSFENWKLVGPRLTACYNGAPKSVQAILYEAGYFRSDPVERKSVAEDLDRRPAHSNS